MLEHMQNGPQLCQRWLDFDQITSKMFESSSYFQLYEGNLAIKLKITGMTMGDNRGQFPSMIMITIERALNGLVRHGVHSHLYLHL